MNFREKGQPYIFYFLLVCWFLMPTALVTRLTHSFVEGVIVLTPLLAFGFWGIKWLKEYEIPLWLWGILIFFAFTTVITQFIPWYPASGLDSVRSFHLKFLLIALSILFIFSKTKLRHSFLWGSVAALAVALGVGYIQYWFGPEIFPWEINLWTDWRPDPINPFGYHKNEFGAYFAYFLPVVAGYGLYWLRRNQYYSTLACAFVFLLSLPILWMSLSRAALGGFLVAVVILLGGFFLGNFSLTRIGGGIIVLLLVAGLIAAGFFLYDAEIEDEMLERLNPEQFMSSLTRGRVGLWKDHWEELESNRWFGLNFSRDQYDDYIDVHTHEHSMYVRFIVDTGLVGLFGFLILFGGLLVNGSQQAWEYREYPYFWMHLGIVSSFIGALLVRSFVAKYYGYQLELFCALILATACIKFSVIKEEKNGI